MGPSLPSRFLSHRINIYRAARMKSAMRALCEDWKDSRGRSICESVGLRETAISLCWTFPSWTGRDGDSCGSNKFKRQFKGLSNSVSLNFISRWNHGKCRHEPKKKLFEIYLTRVSVCLCTRAVCRYTRVCREGEQVLRNRRPTGSSN